MNRLCCCCPKESCLLQEDNFNRPDGPISGDWYGDGEIKDNRLIADHDSTTICHPEKYTLGTLNGQCLLKNCDPGITYKIRLGNPNATNPIEVWVKFSTEKLNTDVSYGTMIIELRPDGNTVAESYVYDWENLEEGIKICYVPGLWLCAGPLEPRTLASVAPTWVTTCIGSGGDNCWIRDGKPVGNWMFVEGEFDNFSMEVHYYENRECQDCDCYCVEKNKFYCIPKQLFVTLTTDDNRCINGTWIMRQVWISDLDTTVGWTTQPWPSKYVWVSDPIECPANTTKNPYFPLVNTPTTLRIAIYCNKENHEYPKLRVILIRYPTYGCSRLQWDWHDPNTISPIDYNESIANNYLSVAITKAKSTCKPFYMELPNIVEDVWTCYNPWETCCGGSVDFVGEEDREPVPPPPAYRIRVIITE